MMGPNPPLIGFSAAAAAAGSVKMDATINERAAVTTRPPLLRLRRRRRGERLRSKRLAVGIDDRETELQRHGWPPGPAPGSAGPLPLKQTCYILRGPWLFAQPLRELPSARVRAYSTKRPGIGQPVRFSVGLGASPKNPLEMAWGRR